MDHSGNRGHGAGGSAYWMLALNLVVSGIVMYFVMFAMIDTWRDFHNNLNMAYMALTMVAPMGLLMLATMGGMYSNRALNAGLYVLFAALFLAAFFGIRTQTAIGDRQFIASMIPHHSGAILMCREAALEDAELVALCSQIETAQRREIEQMEAIQARLAR